MTSAHTQTVTVHVQMRFQRRGGRKTIVSDFVAPPPRPRTDNALLKALARAHLWRRRIESGEYASISELAKAERINESYACRVFRLNLLAPSIVTEILNGRHRPDVMLKAVLQPLPPRWDEQVAALNQEQRLE